MQYISLLPPKGRPRSSPQLSGKVSGLLENLFCSLQLRTTGGAPGVLRKLCTEEWKWMHREWAALPRLLGLVGQTMHGHFSWAEAGSLCKGRSQAGLPGGRADPEAWGWWKNRRMTMARGLRAGGPSRETLDERRRAPWKEEWAWGIGQTRSLDVSWSP